MYLLSIIDFINERIEKNVSSPVENTCDFEKMKGRTALVIPSFYQIEDSGMSATASIWQIEENTTPVITSILKTDGNIVVLIPSNSYIEVNTMMMIYSIWAIEV